MKEEIKHLLRRSRVFEGDARNNFNNGDYDVAMFHIEQAIQLMLKAKLLDIIGSYPRTHSLRKLIKELNTHLTDHRLEEILVKYKTTLRDLERAYISARYYYEEFFEDEVLKAFKLYEELWEILWKD